MEFWDRYCGITKNARNILSHLEFAQPEPDVPPSTHEEEWEDLVIRHMNKFSVELEDSYTSSQKFHELIKNLNAGKEGIVSSSKKLNSQCSKLMKDREYLASLNSSIQSKYFYYMHLESLEGQVVLLTRDPVSLKKRYLEIFAQLEDAIDFFVQNPNYIDSNFYQNEYEMLLDTWVSSFTTILSEQLQHFYTYYENHFKILMNSEDIVRIIKQLLISPGRYSDNLYMINSIVGSYLKIRSKHIKNITNDALNQIKSETSLLQQTGVACEVLNRFWRKENKLFNHYFSEDCSRESFNKYFLLYTDLIYEHIRENLLQETDLESLTKLAVLMQSSIEQSNLLIFSKIYEDIQERIIYSVTLYINEEIVPSPSQDPIHPCIYKTIELLQLLQFKLNTEIFDSITGETVNLCISALNGSLPQEDFIEAHAFLIRNLLHLRKEIETFGVLFKSYNYKQLDFTDTRRLFWKLVMGEVSLKKQGVLAELVHSGVPKYSENKNKDLETEFMAACQSFILKTFHEIANPILLFILKTKESSNLTYEQAEKTLAESSNRITSIYPRFCQALQLVLDEKNYQEMANSVSTQILKAFQQLLTFMEQNYQSMPLPSLKDIEVLLHI